MVIKYYLYWIIPQIKKLIFLISLNILKYQHIYILIASLMPDSKYAWSSWNFLNKSIRKKFTLTYWMNLLQNLPTNKNYFVTVNPFKKPNNIINKTIFEHPIYSLRYS